MNYDPYMPLGERLWSGMGVINYDPYISTLIERCEMGNWIHLKIIDVF